MVIKKMNLSIYVFLFLLFMWKKLNLKVFLEHYIIRDNMANLYTGFHAVEERLRRYSAGNENGISLHIFYSKPGPRIKKIIALANSCGVENSIVSEKQLDTMAVSLNAEAREHRGIILSVEGEGERGKNLMDLNQWISTCPENALVVLLDSVTDPHNVGAIIRSCDQFGADLVIIPDHRGADAKDNQIVARTSAGSSSWVPIATVTNLVRSVQTLKDNGFWIYGADAGGTKLHEVEFAAKTCIVMGSEGTGIAHLLEEQCDTIVSIPTCGKIDSLNVSVAAGVLLYECYRRKLK